MSTMVDEEREVRKETRGNTRRGDDHRSWAAGWATAGAAAWAAMAVLARMGVAQIGAIELLFLLAPLVIVPLGLELARVMGNRSRLLHLGQELQPLGAALAVLSFWLRIGNWAGVVAAGWLAVTVVVLLGMGLRPRDRAQWKMNPAQVLEGVAAFDLVIGALWLVGSRLGMRPLGIQEPIGLLTAVHFHFAGFATAMIAGSTVRRSKSSGLAWVAGFVVGMPYLVALGFVISPVLKMVAGILFALSVAGLAVGLWRAPENERARMFLRVASTLVWAGMALAACYAVLDFKGSARLTIPRMAGTHGILNAAGFCLAGLLGWLLEWDGLGAGRNDLRS